jgi:hypothetical protein
MMDITTSLAFVLVTHTLQRKLHANALKKLARMRYFKPLASFSNNARGQPSR